MTQAIEILEKHRLFLIEIEREADVQDAIKAVAITVKQQAEEIQRLRDKNSALTQELDECGMLEKTLRELVKRHERRAIRAEKLVFGEFVAYYASSGEVCQPYIIEEYGEDEPLLQECTTGLDAEECIENFFSAIEAAMKEEK